MKFIPIIMICLLALGCTDATFGKFASLGNSAHVKCYSGGELIYEGNSTGKVISEQSSDGYFFRDQQSGDMMEVSGNCVITYND